MANHRNAKKMIKVIKKRTLINKMYKNKTRTAIKSLIKKISSGDKISATLEFKNVESNLHRCVNKGIIHKNNAARKISSFNSKIKRLLINS